MNTAPHWMKRKKTGEHRGVVDSFPEFGRDEAEHRKNGPGSPENPF
jgi:hypothetical protein